MDLQTAAQTIAAHPQMAQEAQERWNAMLAHSATDYEFRRKLITNPRVAVSEFTGRKVPESFNVTFVENDADATIVLPDPIDPEAELSEHELTTVAGGVTTSSVCLTLATVALALWLIDEAGERDG